MEKIINKQHIELAEGISLQYKQKEEDILNLCSPEIDASRLYIKSCAGDIKTKNDALGSLNKKTDRDQVESLKNEIKKLKNTSRQKVSELTKQYANHSNEQRYQLSDAHHKIYSQLLEQLFEKGVYIESPGHEQREMKSLVNSKEVKDIIRKDVKRNVINGYIDKKKAIELAQDNVVKYIKDSLWYKNKMQRIEKSFDNLKKQTQLSSDYASSPSDIKKIVDQATKGEITHTIEQQVKQQAVDIAYQYTRKLAEQEAEYVAKQEAEKEAWRLAEHFVRQEAEKEAHQQAKHFVRQEAEKEAHQQAERFIQQEAKKEARRQAQSFVEKEAARHINDVTEQYAAQFFKIDANLEQAKLDFNLDREEEALMDRRLKNLRSRSSHAQGSRQAELLDSDGKPKIVTI